MKNAIKQVAVVMTAGLLLTGCSERTQQDIDHSAVWSGVVGQLGGAGASSQEKAVEIFAVHYQQRAPGARAVYVPSGSAPGKQQFIAGEVDFAGVDTPLDAEQTAAATERCHGNPPVYLPLVNGRIALTYRLAGIRLSLSAPVVTRIFNGEIKKWNDPAIAALNPGTKLPDVDIITVYRADQSDTAAIFNKFFNITKPNGTISASGSRGVGEKVAQTEGAIGYTELGFIGKLRAAKIDFGFGTTDIKDDTYPLKLTTSHVVCSAGYDKDTVSRLKDYVNSALSVPDTEMEKAGYMPLTEQQRQEITEKLANLQNS